MQVYCLEGESESNHKKISKVLEAKEDKIVEGGVPVNYCFWTTLVDGLFLNYFSFLF